MQHDNILNQSNFYYYCLIFIKQPVDVICIIIIIMTIKYSETLCNNNNLCSQKYTAKQSDTHECINAGCCIYLFTIFFLSNNETNLTVYDILKLDTVSNVTY